MRASDAQQRLGAEQERLRDLREQAVTALGQAREAGATELASYDQHDADSASELHELEVNEAVVESLDAEIAEIEAALGRIDDGTYGRCEHCGLPIPDERLAVVPAARFCAEHQPATRPGP